MAGSRFFQAESTMTFRSLKNIASPTTISAEMPRASNASIAVGMESRLCTSPITRSMSRESAAFMLDRGELLRAGDWARCVQKHTDDARGGNRLLATAQAACYRARERELRNRSGCRPAAPGLRQDQCQLHR